MYVCMYVYVFVSGGGKEVIPAEGVIVPFSVSSSNSARRDVKPVVRLVRRRGWVSVEVSTRDDDDDGDEALAVTVVLLVLNT